MSRASKYFQQAFPKYDDLNASVQENVSAIRVVKAYVREGHETSKFQKASGNIYNIFCKAEKNISYNAPLMQFTVYSCILLDQLAGRQDDRWRQPDNRRADESSYLLHEYPDEPDDALHGICYDDDELSPVQSVSQRFSMRKAIWTIRSIQTSRFPMEALNLTM